MKKTLLKLSINIMSICSPPLLPPKKILNNARKLWNPKSQRQWMTAYWRDTQELKSKKLCNKWTILSLQAWSFGAPLYQNHCPIIGKGISETVFMILNGEGTNYNLKSTFIGLITNKSKPNFVSKFRPINICNVLYKIVSKIITNSLKPLINSIISSKQISFISGRIITDNIILAHEMIHCLKNIKRGREGKMAIKLDLSKAFNIFEWNYIEQVLHTVSFRNY